MSAWFEFWPNFLGHFLRTARERLGYSLRDVGRLSGVSHSQVLRLERGDYSCALDTFVRIATVLGLPFAEMLEQSVKPRRGLSSEFVERDPKLQTALNGLGAIGDRQRRFVLFFVESLVEEVAYLMFSGHPVRRASESLCEHAVVRSRLLAFAQSLERGVPAQYRRVVLENLRCGPVVELVRLGILEEASLPSLLQTVIGDYQNGIRWMGPEAPAYPEWLPSVDGAGWMYRELGKVKLKAASEIYLTTAAGGFKGRAMPSWLELRRLLVKLTAHRGAKSHLARECGVTRSAVTSWLRGKAEPGAAATLRLLEFMSTAQAKQKQSGAAASTAAAPKPAKSASASRPKRSARGKAGAK